MFCNSVKTIVVLTTCLAMFATGASGMPTQPNLAVNGHMKGITSSGSIPDWQPFEGGYTRDPSITHRGSASVRCSSSAPTTTFGALQTITLNQQTPEPVVMSAWSRASKAHGQGGANYCLYVDVTYADGTHLWGQSVNFDAGTHGWQRRRETILPAKPIQSMNVYLLFRNFAGTAWFGDVKAIEISGTRVWDGQAVSPPKQDLSAGSGGLTYVGTRLRLGFAHNGALIRTILESRTVGSTTGGFFVRDVTANGSLLPLHGAVTKVKTGHGAALDFSCGVTGQGIRLHARVEPSGSSILIRGTIANGFTTTRDLTIYFTLPVDARGWRWGSDIRSSQVIANAGEYHNWAPVSVGACGSISRYPFAEVSNRTGGVMLALSPKVPATSRLFYNAAAQQLVAAFDFALGAVGSHDTKHTATFKLRLAPLPPAPARWGFREAAAAYYAMHPRGFPSATVTGGIWIPFTNPKTVSNAADFHFRYHEGDNSTLTDRALHILSFHYSEPSSFWLPMPPSVPRTYAAVMGLIRSQLLSGTPTQKAWAAALLNSGTRNVDGRLNVQFRDEPWCNGALFILNPNPALAAKPGAITKSTLTYSPSIANNRYVTHAATAPSGEYLDSLEAWLNTETDVPRQIAACPYPATFDTASLSPTVPQWYSLFSLVQSMSTDLHKRGKQLMANTTPVNFWCFMPMLDEAGIEVNWLDNHDRYSPDSDATFDYRRTLSFRKPYLLMMNTNFNKFNDSDMKRYFLRCLFYDVFPSCFSADAADHPYWETPQWYDRDRKLFETYVPIMQKLSRAGWQPIPDAEVSNATIYLERYGKRWFTLRNSTNAPQQTIVRLWSHELNIVHGGTVTDSLSPWHSELTHPEAGRSSFKVILAPHEVMAIRLATN